MVRAACLTMDQVVWAGYGFLADLVHDYYQVAVNIRHGFFARDRHRRWSGPSFRPACSHQTECAPLRAMTDPPARINFSLGEVAMWQPDGWDKRGSVFFLRRTLT